MKTDLATRLQALSREWFTPGSPMSKTIEEASELIRQQRVANKVHVKRTSLLADVIRKIQTNIDDCANIT